MAVQLRAVNADIEAARAAGDAHGELKALREKEQLLMEKEILLMKKEILRMEEENLLLRVRVHGLDALQPGMCLLLVSRYPCFTARN